MVTRRQLLSSAAAFLLLSTHQGFARVISGNGLPWSPNAGQPPTPVRPGPWKFFTADEANLVESIVDRLIPSDDLGPGGKEAGCAVFIDRQLAGPYGDGEDTYIRPPFMPGTKSQGYQGANAPAMRYRESLKAIDAHIKQSTGGKFFHQLSPGEQDNVLSELESGKIELKDKTFFQLLVKNTKEGFFADPIYGGNRDMAGWKLIGFPGAVYDYRDWIERHNERYPHGPVGIMNSTLASKG